MALCSADMLISSWIFMSHIPYRCRLRCQGNTINNRERNSQRLYTKWSEWGNDRWQVCHYLRHLFGDASSVVASQWQRLRGVHTLPICCETIDDGVAGQAAFTVTGRVSQSQPSSGTCETGKLYFVLHLPGYYSYLDTTYTWIWILYQPGYYIHLDITSIWITST